MEVGSAYVTGAVSVRVQYRGDAEHVGCRQRVHRLRRVRGCDERVHAGRRLRADACRLRHDGQGRLRQGRR